MVESDPPPSAPPSQTRKERRPLAVVNDVLDGKYRLLRPLKRGSMGAVFAAENVTLGVPVAVKVVRADVRPEAKAELAERMVQEAHAAFQVDHPAILRVLDVGTTHEGDPYVVMELLRGETLAAAMKDHGPVGPAQTIRVLLPIAHALVTAHACKVVHRDVKPSNVFLARTSDGRIQPKLIDFGLAKALRPTRKRITQEGNTMGSPAYMAPEQIRGEDVTGQADVWGFCVTLYEMMTGELPFEARELEVLFTRVLFDPPRPLRDHGITDEELWAIVTKGLRKDPEQRWSGMKELGAALAEWLLDRGYIDDVCASSLQSTWLEPMRAPGKLDLLATAPIPITRRVSRLRMPSLSELTTGKWERVKRKRSPWPFWVMLVLLVAGIAGAVASYRGMTWASLTGGAETTAPSLPALSPSEPSRDAPTSTESERAAPPSGAVEDETTATSELDAGVAPPPGDAVPPSPTPPTRWTPPSPSGPLAPAKAGMPAPSTRPYSPPAAAAPTAPSVTSPSEP